MTSKSLVPTVPETLCPESKPLRFLGFLPLSLHGNSGPSATNPVAVGQPKSKVLRELHLVPGQHLEQVFSKCLLLGFHSWAGDPWPQVVTAAASPCAASSVLLF